MGFLGGFIVWLLLALLVGKFASNKGRSFGWFVFWAIILSPLIGFLIALFVEDKTYLYTPAPERKKQCNFCGSYIPYVASVCSQCGRDLNPSISKSYSSSSTSYSSNSSEEKWKCSKCSILNSTANIYCESCNTARWTYDTLPKDKKETVDELKEKLLGTKDFEEAYKIQQLYFQTSNLKYVTLFIPDTVSYKNFDEYKNDIKNIGPTEEEVITENTSLENEIKEQTISSEADQIKQLESVKNLFEKGLIDESEYKQKKAQILGL